MSSAPWLGTGPPFTWALAFSGNSKCLAIGHWDSYAYVVRIADELLEIAALRRGDRVYAIDLDASGGRLVVAGRDKIAAVYCTTNHQSQPYVLIYDPSAKAFVCIRCLHSSTA